ncbi:GbNV-gb19-like [Penaeus vannamei nudivirus]|nr:esterase [Penaeus vannamei nucleopolyhedrovirus]
MEAIVTPYIIFTTTVLCIFILIIIYLISVIVYPKKPIEYIRKTLNLRSSSDLLEDATSWEEFIYDNNIYNLYFYKKQDNFDVILLDFPGGAFISCSNSLKPYKYIDQPYNVISIEYPVLPEGTIPYTMKFLHELMEYLNKTYNNPKYIFMAASAGCMYATKLMNSNKYNVIKYISMNGYYGYSTVDNMLSKIGDHLYLRNSKKEKCKPPPSNVKCMYAITEDDFLKSSTENYTSSFGAQDQIIKYEGNDHCFYNRYNSLEAKLFYKDVEKFIKN